MSYLAENIISTTIIMPRKIDINNIGRNSKRHILKYVSDMMGFKTNKNDLIKIAVDMGLDVGFRSATKEKRVYKFFGEMLNEQMSRKIEMEKKEKDRKRMMNIFSIKQLDDKLLRKKLFSKQFKTEEDKTKPLSVVMISRVVSNVKRTMNFNNYYHLKNWLEQQGDAINWEKDSEGNSYSTESESKPKDAFELFNMKIKFVEGGEREWGENKKTITRKIKFLNYEAKAFDPATTKVGDNNCGIRVLSKLLDTRLNVKQIRNDIHSPAKTLLNTDQLHDIYKHNDGKKKLVVIDSQYEGEFDMKTTDYILFKDNHYTAIVEATRQKHKEDGNKKQKGKLAFDIETRTTEEVVMVGETKSKVLKSAILSMVYKPVRGTKQTKTFTTDSAKNCCVKFLDWLGHEANAGRYYNCVAHNGSRFDFYLLMSYFTEQDLLDSNTQLRGTSIIGLQYKSHTFKDPCCFLTNTLENLCDGYLITPEEKAFSKLTNIKVGDKTMTNYQLCFYKPELTFDEFMQLEKKEPEFWCEYVKYCEYDCESLYLVWEKFKFQIDTIIGKMGVWLKKFVSLNTCNTIGSLSKKLIDNINNVKRTDKSKGKPNYTKYCQFMNDDEKYEFIKNFKRGGISHSNQMGFHSEGVCGFDIKSQYPTALMNMNIPVGVSRWVTQYEPSAHGFYHIHNICWGEDATRFKPVARRRAGYSLDWAENNIPDLYCDSYMIEYLMQYCGLISFDVSKGLVSNEEMSGDKLFNTYVHTLYKEKAEQDALKDAGEEAYNKPYREAVKLLMNSLTGKLVEDPSRYFKLEFKNDDEKAQTMNGVKINKVDVDKGMNYWLVAGVMVYSYSKRILWDYVNCLPNKADDVIHIETDGIYFGLPNRETFIENLKKKNDPMIKIGDELGNVEEEVCTTEESFFLGKKDYLIGETKLKKDGTINYEKSKLRFKGVPKKTIDDEGSKIDLLDKQFYIDRYNGHTVTKTFKTIGKALYDTKRTTGITLNGYNMTRKSIPHNCKQFKVYSVENEKVKIDEWKEY